MRLFLLAALLLSLTSCPTPPQEPEPLTQEQIDSLMREFRAQYPKPRRFKEQLQENEPEEIFD